MRKLSDALSQWAPERGAAREPIHLLEAAWPEIVGAQVAANSHPARIGEGTLVVTVRSSAWSHQLSFLSEHVLRALHARMPQAGVERLRLRVGRLTARPARAALPARPAPEGSRRPQERPEAATAGEALARFREGVEHRQRARRGLGWKECPTCGALVSDAGGGPCVTCRSAGVAERAAAAARTMFEAPWLGFAGTAALVDGLKQEEYERVRAALLARWWDVLARARSAKRLSRDGRERAIASSYVVLRSKIPPEEIVPATVRNVLGDELHELLYGNAERRAGER